MEQFFTNYGLAHIGENIFQNLDYQSLVLCQNVCHTWKFFLDLDNPHFWIKSFLIPKIQQDDDSRKISYQDVTSVTWKNLFEKTYMIYNNINSWEYLHWKKLIIETFQTSLKSKVLKVLFEQKETEDGIRNPLYMALKVKDTDLIQHLLLIFWENYFPGNSSRLTDW